MTETARDITLAILALEEVVTTLRALFDDLNEPDTEPDTEPVPDWPTAPYVWHAGELWLRHVNSVYETAGDFWEEGHMTNNLSSEIRVAACLFARGAVPVTPVPTEAWETWKRATRDLDYTPDCELIDAVDSLAQEVAR